MLVLTKSATRRARSVTSAGGAKFRSITLPFAANLAGDGPAETQSSANPLPSPERLSPGGDRKGADMRMVALALTVLLAGPAAVAQDKKYPPISDYMMEQGAEIALARSAAPDNVSGPATVKVLTPQGVEAG